MRDGEDPFAGTSLPWPTMAGREDARQRIASQVEAYFIQHAETLFRRLRTRFVSEADAADAVQECFLKMSEALSRREQIDHPRAWLFTVGNNLLLDWRKHEGRTTERTSAIASHLTEDLTRSQPRAPDEQILDQEEMAAFEAALHHLDPVREFLMRGRAAGCSLQELADAIPAQFLNTQPQLKDPKYISREICRTVRFLQRFLKQ